MPVVKSWYLDEDGNEHTVADPKGINERIAKKLDELEIEDVDVQQRLERELSVIITLSLQPADWIR